MESINTSTEEAMINVADKLRPSLHLEDLTVEWRFGKPPSFETINHLFEDGKTKVWPEGSLEETVQNIVKTLHMEISHKIRLQDFKTIDHQKFKFFVNGREGLSGEEILEIGGFNAMLQSSLPEEFQYFKADKETTYESAYKDFKSCFPRGFAWEVIQVYSGPPLIAFKFRHWGFFEGPYKAHSPTGEMLQFYGFGTLKVDLSIKVEEAETFYDAGELFGVLLKAKKSDSEPKTHHNNDKDLAASVACPFSKKLDK